MGLYFNNIKTKHSLMLNENNFSALKEVLNEVGGLNNTTGG